MRKPVFILLVCCLMVASLPLVAAPVGYSINSDSPTGNADSLYRIDLGAGTDTLIGQINPHYEDVEGLAFAPDGKLYALDDDRLRIFELDKANGRALLLTEKQVSNLPGGGRNDFGMAFACDGTLYVTSVVEGQLYQLNSSGQAAPIGNLGANISALAAWGHPTRLYGLGNGLRHTGDDVYQPDAPNLYTISPDTGAATLVGALGNEVAPYTEGGLDFDTSGQLWAITDRHLPDNQPSQVMKIDTASGKASEVKTLQEVGFESLAIAPPTGCDTVGETPPGNQHSAYTGVPTLNYFGRAVAAMLLLLAGLLAVRRL